MLEGNIDHVIGVDTHCDSHTAAVLDPNGGLVTQLEIPSDQAGAQSLLGVVAERAPGRRCWAVEGTGCYGAGLASFLADHGEWVVEVDWPKRPRGRTGAKSDVLDAIRAGREALSREQLACPRQRGHREALRVLHLTRSGAVKVSADARRHLKALLVTAPEPLRAELRRGTWLRQAQACTALVAAATDPVEHWATVEALRLTAQRALAAHQEASALAKELRVLVQAMAPVLLTQPGVGPVTAAQLLISWSHPGRLRSEAAFAMLAGVAPIPASSGRVVRYRLNRGGDRQLNRALHTIVMIREAWHEPTKRYVARRTAQGKSHREIRRCLARAVARGLYRLLEQQTTAAPGQSWVTASQFASAPGQRERRRRLD
jgi:transposase